MMFPQPLQLADDPTPSSTGPNSMASSAFEDSRPSPKDTLSMPFIKRHIRRRLTNAKDTCDKELRKVVASITEYVEGRLREASSSAVDTGSVTPPVSEQDPFLSRTANVSLSDLNVRDLNAGDEEALGDETEPESHHLGGHSRRVSSHSVSSSPNSLRRHPTLPKDGSNSASNSPGKVRAAASVPSSSSASYSQTGVSRRLSRNMHIPITMPHHAHSRSQSRSRSPLPPSATDLATSPRSQSTLANRRLSRFNFDDVPNLGPNDPFMTTLHEVISIATDIADTPISTLITEPKTCADFVLKVQKVGKAWDLHSDWQGRGWYVQLLLAVAGLSRVVEWWEAEKQFWNFEDEGDEDVEPMTFVLKPEDDNEDEGDLGGTTPGTPNTEILNETLPMTTSGGLERRISRVGRAGGGKSISGGLGDSSRSRRSSIGSAIRREMSDAASTISAVPSPVDGRRPLSEALNFSAATTPAYGSRNASMEQIVQIGTPPVMTVEPVNDPATVGVAAPVTTTDAKPDETKVEGEVQDISSPETNKAKAAENLRVQAEQAQSINIVMEIGLEQEQIMWANQAWEDIIGSSISDLMGTSLTDLLAPEDRPTLKEAIRVLREDSSRTVEARFRIRVVDPIDPLDDSESTNTESTTSAVPASMSPFQFPMPGSQAPSIAVTPSPLSATEPRTKPAKRPTLRKALSAILRPGSAISDRNNHSPAPMSAPPSAPMPISMSASLPMLDTSTPAVTKPPIYRDFDGKGMLMLDRTTGTPSHTMWVIKPITEAAELIAPGDYLDVDQAADETLVPNTPGMLRLTGGDPTTPFPFSLPVSSQNILCRICEQGIPEWFFEKHNETCAESHRLEAVVVECNESMLALRNIIHDLSTALDRDRITSPPPPTPPSSPGAVWPTSPLGVLTPEYRGMPIFGSSSTGSGSGSGLSLSSLQLFRPQLGSKRKKKLHGNKMHKALLETLDDILEAALEIAMPSLKDDQKDQPLERQRLLSPTSERKVDLVSNWRKPSALMSNEDDAVVRLVEDVEMLIRTKLDNVKRLENTIIYSEKIRQEWEEMMQRAITNGAIQEEDEEDDVEGMDILPPVEEECGEDGAKHSPQSSTRSEYAFDGEDSDGRRDSSMEPTPIGTHTPARTPSNKSRSSVILASSATGLGLSSSLGPGSSISPPTPLPVTTAVPATWQGIGSFSHTRSSTPSSISSPLALAAPIVAAQSGNSPTALHHPVPRSLPSTGVTVPFTTSPMPMTGDRPAPIVIDNSSHANTIRARPASGQNLILLEQRVATGLTPPISPLVATRENLSASVSSESRHSRKHSNVIPIISPSNTGGASGPLSPRIPSIAPASRATPSSIKDFDMIKPISKGAFGAVFLSKKKTTGDYYAIKVLKKADMIAKNQITNVKAERMIMMRQAESPFVVKLYWTFQSRDNLYLVMEYLNGGDCAALIKTLGCLPEEWTRGYVAEIVLGLEYLHATGVVHRDLKPDNLLIDSRGHLKLTDFGLSHIGLLGRQTQTRGLVNSLERVASIDRGKKRHSPSSRHMSVDSTYFANSPLLAETAIANLSPSYFNPKLNVSTDNVSESSGSDSPGAVFWPKTPAAGKPYESPLQSFAADLTHDLRSHSNSGSGTPPGEQKFVGTPDYLAPESILGLSEDDRAVDWWAVGVITYEFLYGIPPFNDETPEKVFANIINRRIEWHSEEVDFSEEAMDYMQRLLTSDPKQRLGFNGAAEVKQHAWLKDIDWDTVTTTEAQFVPQVEDPESTDYFDPRGAVPHLFQDEEAVEVTGRPQKSPQGSGHRASSSSPAIDEFGTFNFKNLPELKKANEDVIRKLKTDHGVPLTQALSDPASIHRRKSISVRKPPNLTTTGDPKNIASPPSPSTSTSSIASSPSRGSMPPSTPGSSTSHVRRPSEFGPIDRFRQHQLDDTRRNSMPSRLRTSSMSSVDVEQEGVANEHWRNLAGTPATSVASTDMRRVDEEPRPPKTDKSDQAVTCLIAEDNPISIKIMETLLTRMGCRCVLVHDGAEAISVALGEIKFDVIFMDFHMPIMDGETAARYIKNTNNKNTNVPIISVSAYSHNPAGGGNLYAASLSKPVQKGDIVNVLRQLGFKTAEGPKGKVAR